MAAGTVHAVAPWDWDELLRDAETWEFPTVVPKFSG